MARATGWRPILPRAFTALAIMAPDCMPPLLIPATAVLSSTATITTCRQIITLPLELAMRYAHSFQRVLPIMGWLATLASTAFAFEGRITAGMIQGNETNALLYTVGTTSLRVEMTATNSDKSRAGWPNPVDILDRTAGTLTMLFPNNRSFVHLKPATDASVAATPGLPGVPMPPGIGPQSAPGASPMPAMPNM